MNSPDQPNTSRTISEQSRPSLEDTLDQAKQSQLDLAALRAVGKSIADLAEALDRLAQEEDNASRA
jgi:hypothetical protein